MPFFKQAMILAAGLGTRLQPLTFHLPKPLFPVLNRPLLHRLLDQLEDAGFKKIVINCSHLAHLVLENVGSYKAKAEIVTLVEPSLLGTGGALRNALPHISENEPLLVINGDVVTDLDPDRVVNLHQHHGAKASLVVHKKEPWNNVAVTDEADENNRCLVGQGTELPGDLIWKDWVSIGHRVSLGSGVTLCRSVIWEGSDVPSGAVLEDCVFIPYGNISS
ncbi:MAG: hypothetical protein C4B58_14880 [Deltaproteobacteria bacterium]|nr:MAG: hypothetical protein C4B58_14880 [Deltaproteobacteria bacterium]